MARFIASGSKQEDGQLGRELSAIEERRLKELLMMQRFEQLEQTLNELNLPKNAEMMRTDFPFIKRLGVNEAFNYFIKVDNWISTLQNSNGRTQPEFPRFAYPK